MKALVVWCQEKYFWASKFGEYNFRALKISSRAVNQERAMHVKLPNFSGTMRPHQFNSSVDLPERADNKGKGKERRRKGKILRCTTKILREG